MIRGPRRGYVFNFENGIKNASNDVILLADQDDIWENNKIIFLKQYFSENPDIEVINHSGFIFNNEGVSVIPKGFSKFNGKYFGCCMALRRSYAKKLLPFPSWTPTHDQLIAFTSILRRSFVFLDDIPLMRHRIHESNLTRRGSIIKAVVFRIKIYSAVAICFARMLFK